MSGIEYFETKTSQCRGHVPGHEPKDCACKTEYRFRVRAANGEIIAQSEGYTTQQACKKGAAALTEMIITTPYIMTQILTGFVNAELNQLAQLKQGVIDKGDLIAITTYLMARRTALTNMPVDIQVDWMGGP